MLNLKQIRNQKDITQSQLAHMSGVAQSYICELEQGKYDCSVSRLCSICKALEITPNEMIKEEFYK